jgi:hypothetical protein
MAKIGEYEKKLSSHPVLKQMHLPEGDNIWTSHQIRKQKTSFHLKSLHTMNSQPTAVDSDLIRYRSKICPFHGLHRSFLVTKTPDIKVKQEFQEEYKIRFCQDLMINMINEARLEFNTAELHFFNRMVLNRWKKQGNLSDNDHREIGNQPHLTTSSNHLRSTSLSFFPPWTYAQGKSMYFPLQLCGDRDNLDHNIDFILDLSQLLIMEKNGDWIPVEMDKLEIVGNVVKIPVPQLVGEYTTLTKNECSHHVCIGSGDVPADYFVKNVYYQEDDDKVGLGEKITIRFDSKKTDPISRVDWGVINVTRTDRSRGYIFNYGENLSPIKKSSLTSSVDTVFRNLDSHITEVVLNSQSKEPCLSGWNTWRNSILLNEDDRKFSPSMTFDGGDLCFTLCEGESENTDKFVGFCIMERMTCFRFTSYPKTEKERKEMGATIEEIQ